VSSRKAANALRFAVTWIETPNLAAWRAISLALPGTAIGSVVLPDKSVVFERLLLFEAQHLSQLSDASIIRRFISSSEIRL